MRDSIENKRTRIVDDLISSTKSLLATDGLNRETLSQVQNRMDALAADATLWSDEDYPAPNEDEKQNRFRIGGEGSNGITLYLNVMRPGKKIPPHNHTTWACVSAVDGIEYNTLYDRLDDGAEEGKAQIKARETVALAPGASLAMMPDDIHSVEIKGDQIIRHLHFYGQPLETLSERKMFDIDAGTYRIMDIGVKSKG